jgi:hypothetical protein
VLLKGIICLYVKYFMILFKPKMKSGKNVNFDTNLLKGEKSAAKNNILFKC